MRNILSRIIATVLLAVGSMTAANAQINAERVMRIGQNVLWLEDYVLSIQYFNQAIAAKPFLGQPYFYRAVAKLNLEDYAGAERDATAAIERNPFITDAYEVRGLARFYLGRPGEAVDDYNHVLGEDPRSRALLYHKAIAQEEMKDYAGADSTYSQLMRYHPRFEGGYLGRAKLAAVNGDTIAALESINRALEINANSVNALVMRADLAIQRDKDFKSALADMDAAIKLQPRIPGFFINRSYLRYNLDDYYGAMADLDYAVELDPVNSTARYNRALLRAEVHDTNHAIEDLDRVLQLNPDDYRALFNRAILYQEVGALNEGIRDLDRLIAAFPNFSAAYFLRFDMRRARGDRGAMTDYNKSIELAKKRVDLDRGTFIAEATPGDSIGETQEQVEARFKSLLTVSDNTTPDEIYNSKDIKGKVQDHRTTIEIEPMFELSYYMSPTELKPDGEYIKEAADLNATRQLRFNLQVTNRPPTSTDEEVFERHTNSIANITSYLASHTPRAVDYFGRAMDYITLRDYQHAIEDLSRAIDLTPDFALAYLARAIATFNSVDTDLSDEMRYRSLLPDLDRVIKLSPRMAIAHYNKGVALATMQDYTSAIAAFSAAIELKPDFGEAYYNRGYVYLRLGNREAGMADLSKAGELGIVPSYSLLKRMAR